MSEINGVPSATFVALFALAMIVFSMLMMCRIVPERRRAPQVMRHEIYFRGTPVQISPNPNWLGERIVSGFVGKNGDTLRLNGSTIGLSSHFTPGARVAVHIVRA